MSESGIYDLITWLYRVLDDQGQAAEAADSDAGVARVKAETAIVDRAVFERDNANGDRDLSHDADQWESVVQLLAYGHRFDSPGWQKHWTPDLI